MERRIQGKRAGKSARLARSMFKAMAAPFLSNPAPIHLKVRFTGAADCLALLCLCGYREVLRLTMADTSEMKQINDNLLRLRAMASRALYRAAAAGVAVFLMEQLAKAAGLSLPLVPFVTSIVLTVAAPDVAASRPYAVITGHILSALAGFAVLLVLGQGETQNGLAVSLAVMAMLFARALHPPAALDAFVATSQGVGLGWFLVPVLAGALLLALYGRAAFYIEQKIFDRA